MKQQSRVKGLLEGLFVAKIAVPCIELEATGQSRNGYACVK